MKRWIVTVVNYESECNCNGKARILGVFKTREEAKNYVDEDIREWVDSNTGDICGCECDFDEMSAWYDYDDTERCEWNIEEVEIDD